MEDFMFTENEDKTKGDKIYIRVYEPWKNYYSLSGKQKWFRDYKVYDISNIEMGFEDPKEYYDYGVDGDGNIVVGENPQVEVSLVFATDESAMPVYQSFISYFFNKYPAIDTTEDLSLYDVNSRRAVGDYETYSVTMYNAIVDSSSIYKIDIMESVV